MEPRSCHASGAGAQARADSLRRVRLRPLDDPARVGHDLAVVGDEHRDLPLPGELLDLRRPAVIRCMKLGPMPSPRTLTTSGSWPAILSAW